MKEKLLILDKALKTNFVALYSLLNLPLLNDEITSLEQRYKVQLPPELKLFYRWKNGQRLYQEMAFINGLCFFPLEEMLILYTKEATLHGFATGQFPFLGNTSGYRSFICYDTNGQYNGKKGEIFQLNSSESFDEDIAINMETFISQINQYIQSISPKKQNGEIDMFFNSVKRTR